MPHQRNRENRIHLSNLQGMIWDFLLKDTIGTLAKSIRIRSIDNSINVDFMIFPPNILLWKNFKHTIKIERIL